MTNTQTNNLTVASATAARKPTLDQQIEKLREVQASGEGRVLRITPELAAHILACTGNHNRRLDRKKARKWGRLMGRGKWGLTGEALKFDPDGGLLDGQHRLTGCIEENVPFDTYVVGNIDPKTFFLMDNGTPRTTDTVFEMLSVPNARFTGKATRWVVLLEDWSRRADEFTSAGAYDIWTEMKQEERDALVWAAQGTNPICRMHRGAFNAPMLCGLLYHARRKHPKEAEAFLAALKDGIGVGKKLITLGRDYRSRKWTREVEQTIAGTMINAWNCYAPGGHKNVKATDLLHHPGGTLPEFA